MFVRVMDIWVCSCNGRMVVLVLYNLSFRLNCYTGVSVLNVHWKHYRTV